MSAILESVLKEGPIGLAARSDGAGLEALMSLLDELAHGIVMTDLAGQLLHANRAARSELARSRFIGLQAQMLTAPTVEGQKALLEALARAAGGKRSLLRVGEDGVRLSLAIVPLRSGAAIGRIAILFERPAVCDPAILCAFARNHGLTATEEHVLGILCEGHSTPAVARQMNVAVSTIRSHVRSLCAKTQSRGVRELMLRVAMLPPVAPGVRQEQLH